MDPRRQLFCVAIAVLATATPAAAEIQRRQLAVDDTTVYWTQGTRLLATPRAGGATTILTRVEMPVALAVDAKHVYFVDENVIKAVPKAGGTAVTLHTFKLASDPGWRELAVDRGELFYCTPEQVGVLPAGGGKPRILATASTLGIEAMAVDRDAVYWFADGKLSRVPRSGGKATVLARGQRFPEALVADGTHVYWLSMTDETGGLHAGALRRIDKRGGTAETLADKLGGPELLRAADRLYWFDDTTTIVALDRSGKQRDEVAKIASPTRRVAPSASDPSSIVDLEIAGGTVYATDGIALFRAPTAGGRFAHFAAAP